MKFRFPWESTPPVTLTVVDDVAEAKALAMQEVRESLARVEHQNGGLLRSAHIFAVMLVVATSVASLISLAGETIKQVLSKPITGGSIPSLLSLVITFVLVMAMDTGNLYAAAMVRVLSGRRSGIKEMAIHVSIMVIVSLLEGATYIYMLYLYESPQNRLSWVLIVVRGIAVPLLALYLSMAQPISVTTADMSKLSELINGKAVLNDLVILATDPDAQAPHLARKIAMYVASADMSDKDKGKLRAMYAAATSDVVNIDQLIGHIPEGLRQLGAPSAAAPSIIPVPVPTVTEQSGELPRSSDGDEVVEEDQAELEQEGPGALTPDQADMLRVRILKEGYPLADIERAMNERLRRSLVTKVRRTQLKQLTGLSDSLLDARIKELFPRARVK